MLTNQNLAPHEARHHPVPAVCLHKRWRLKEILKDGIFTLSSPFGVGKSCLRLVFNLQYFNNAIYALAHTYIVYFLIYNFFNGENFGQENFGDSVAIRQIRQNFLPPIFCIVRYQRGRKLFILHLMKRL